MTPSGNSARAVRYGSTRVSDVDIFSREAGDPAFPKLLLLHGLASSSHQFRDLMPALAHRFHVIAPDYPGCGHSGMAEHQASAGAFDRVAAVIAEFCRKRGFLRFGLYAQGYGGSVGLRLIDDQPDRLEWLIIQNANIYELGFTREWDRLRAWPWDDATAGGDRTRDVPIGPGLVRRLHVHGHRQIASLSPDSWTMACHFLDRPGAAAVQRDLLMDDRRNIDLYPRWQRLLAARQPDTVIFWGQGDLFFNQAGGEAYRTALPDAELHRLDTGHFALEDCLDEIADGMISFYDRVVTGPPAGG